MRRRPAENSPSLPVTLAVTGFGPSRFDPSPDTPGFQIVAGARVSTLRARVRESCPRRPGVYGMLTADGDLIYVGKAKSLRARLLTYFRPRSRDKKAGKIIRDARAILWEPQPGEFAALLRELELIRRFRPRLNVQGQPLRRRLTYVCLGRSPAPYAFVSRRPPRDVLAWYGPLPAGRRASEAVLRLNDLFLLRDCPTAQEVRFAGQGDLFPLPLAAGCIRHEIGTCSAPCAAGCSAVDYRVQTEAARRLLDGRDITPLERLRAEMTNASSRLEFERAGALRDRLSTLLWLTGQLARLREARHSLSFVYPVRGSHQHQNDRDRWYLIHRGCVHAVLTDPGPDPAARSFAAAKIKEAFAAASLRAELDIREEIDAVFLVAGWFRRDPAERQKTISPAELTARLRGGSEPRPA